MLSCAMIEGEMSNLFSKNKTESKWVGLKNQENLYQYIWNGWDGNEQDHLRT